MGEVNHQELAAETLRVLAERGWSRKQAEIRTGVGNQFSLMQILGHTGVQMTARYVQFAQADIERQQRAYSPVDRLRRR